MQEQTDRAGTSVHGDRTTEQTRRQLVRLGVAQNEKDERRVEAVLPLDQIALLGAAASASAIKFRLETETHL